MGQGIVVHTRRGDVVIQRSESVCKQSEPLATKVPGRIVGDLHEADAELREMLVWPRR